MNAGKTYQDKESKTGFYKKLWEEQRRDDLARESNSVQINRETASNDEEEITFLSPRQFADAYFIGVEEYSWELLQQYLESNGSKEQNENLKVLLKEFIVSNPELSPDMLWTQITIDPTALKIKKSTSNDIEGEDKKPQFVRSIGKIKTIEDFNSGLNDLKTDKIEYERRKYFIFGKKKKERKRKEASDKATSFLHGTASKIDAVVISANNSKKTLENDLQQMVDDLNSKLVIDALEKEKQTFTNITNIRENATNAKENLRKYYYGSLTVIRENTEEQKEKLKSYANETIEKLNQLESNQNEEIQILYSAFNTSIDNLTNESKKDFLSHGIAKSQEIYTNIKSPSEVKINQQSEVLNEVFNARNEIDTLADKTQRNALGNVTDKDSSFNNESEKKANLSKHQAIAEINERVENTNGILDQQALKDKLNAKNIRDLYDKKIDTQSTIIIETLTKSLQVYYGKLYDFSELQDAAIQSYYTKSIENLNAAYSTQLEQSKARLEAYKTSQAGLKTPRKNKNQEKMDLATTDINPLVDQANDNVTNINDANFLGLSKLNTVIQTSFNELSNQETTDQANVMNNVSEELNQIQQEGINEQLQMRVVHLRKIIRDVKGSQQSLDEEIPKLEKEYQKQLVKLDNNLQKQLNKFKSESEKILDDFILRMDAEQLTADITTRAKLIYDALNNKPFNKKKVLSSLNGISPKSVPALRKEYDEKYSPLRDNRSLFDDIYHQLRFDRQGLFDVFCLLLSPTDPVDFEEGGKSDDLDPVLPQVYLDKHFPDGVKAKTGHSITVNNPDTRTGIDRVLPTGSSFRVQVDQNFELASESWSASNTLKLAFVKKPNGSLITSFHPITIEDAEAGIYDFIYLKKEDDAILPYRIQQKVINIKDSGQELMKNIDGVDFNNHMLQLEVQKIRMGGGVTREQKNTTPYIGLSSPYQKNPTKKQSLPEKNAYNIFQPNPECTYKWYARQATKGQTADTIWRPSYIDSSQNKVFGEQEFTYLGTGNSIGICLNMQGHLIILAEEYDANGEKTGKIIQYVQYVLKSRTYLDEEDPKGEVVGLRHIENAIQDSKKYIKKIEGTPVAIKTGYINTESGTEMSLPIYIGKSANPDEGAYVLVDLLPGQENHLYYGNSIEGCINHFKNYNVYPTGIIFMEVMENEQGFPIIKKNFETDGRTTWELFTTTTGWIAIGMFVVGAILEFVPGGQGLGTALIIDSIALGAVSALSGIIDESQKGEPDMGRIAIDMTTLVGSIFAMGGKAFLQMAALNKTSQIQGKVGKFLYFAGAYSLTGEGIFISVVGVNQIKEIIENDKFSIDEKMRLVSQIIFSLAIGSWLIANVRVSNVRLGRQSVDDFISPHAYNRHKFDPSRISSRSRTQYGKGIDVADIRNQTMKNADDIVPNFENGIHYSTTYKKTFYQNISTSATPTRESRVIINHLDASRSSQFPYYKKGITDGF